jgi:hypothetical protein
MEMVEMMLEARPTDDIARRWVEKVEWAAYWIAGMTDDPALQRRCYDLCGDPRKITREIGEATSRSLAEILSEGSA